MSEKQENISLITKKIQRLNPAYDTPAFVEYLWKQIPNLHQPFIVSSFVCQLDLALIEKYWNAFCLKENLNNYMSAFSPRYSNDSDYVKFLIQMLREDNFSDDKMQQIQTFLQAQSYVGGRPFCWNIYIIDKMRTDKEFERFFKEKERIVKEANAQNKDQIAKNKNQIYFDFLSTRYDWMTRRLYSKFTDEPEIRYLESIYRGFLDYKSHREEGRIKYQHTYQNQNHQRKLQLQDQDQNQSGQGQQENIFKGVRDSNQQGQPDQNQEEEKKGNHNQINISLSPIKSMTQQYLKLTHNVGLVNNRSNDSAAKKKDSLDRVFKDEKHLIGTKKIKRDSSYTSKPTLTKVSKLEMIPKKYAIPQLESIKNDCRFQIYEAINSDHMEITIYLINNHGTISKNDKMIFKTFENAYGELTLKVVPTLNIRSLLSKEGDKIRQALEAKDIRAILDLWYNFFNQGIENVNTKLFEFNRLFTFEA